MLKWRSMVMLMVQEHGDDDEVEEHCDEGHLLDLSVSAVQVTATHEVTVLDLY